MSRQTELAELRLIVDVSEVGAAAAATLTSMYAQRAPSMDAHQLKRRLSELGAAWWVQRDVTHLRWSGYCPSDNAPQVTALLAASLSCDELDAVDVRRAKAAASADVRRRLGDGVGKAEDAVRQIVLAGQPAGTALTETDAAGLEPDEIRRALATAVHAPANLVLVGDVDVAAVDRALAQWPDADHRQVPAPPPAATAGQVWLVDTPGSPQAAITLVGAAPRRDDEGAPALAVALRVVGGTATSWVSRRLREELGWAYYANVHYASVGCVPAVIGRTAVASEYAAPAVRELLNQLRAAANGSLSEDDAVNGARSQAGRLAVETHTAAGLADDVASRIEQGVAPGGRTAFIRGLSQVTAEDVAGAAARYLDPAGLDVVIAADASVVSDAVTAELGPVRLL